MAAAPRRRGGVTTASGAWNSTPGGWKAAVGSGSPATASLVAGSEAAELAAFFFRVRVDAVFFAGSSVAPSGAWSSGGAAAVFFAGRRRVGGACALGASVPCRGSSASAEAAGDAA